MKIQVILSSTRPGRVGERVARWATSVADERDDFEVELVDLRDYDMPHFDEPVSPRFNPNRKPHAAVRRWLDKIAEADGYIFVTPEYYHSITGILKDAIDFTEFQLAKKPAAIVSYGAVGGARAAEQLKLILIEAKAAVVPEAVALMGVTQLLDEHGKFLGDNADPRSPEAALRRTLGELAWWTETLAAGRRAKATV